MRLTTILIVLALAFAQVAMAQNRSIQSKEDYQQVKASINAISQKLYGYGKQYPRYAFTAEYNTQGKVVAMNVSGVNNQDDAKQISVYLLELENLGDLVRNMNQQYLPTSKENAKGSMLTESEALAYVPIFNSGDAMSSSR